MVQHGVVVDSGDTLRIPSPPSSSAVPGIRARNSPLRHRGSHLDAEDIPPRNIRRLPQIKARSHLTAEPTFIPRLEHGCLTQESKSYIPCLSYTTSSHHRHVPLGVFHIRNAHQARQPSG